VRGGAHGDSFDRASVRIEPWGGDDLPLLQKCLGDPALMEHLGGPMSAEKIVERQQHYEQLPTTGQGRMFKIVEVATGESVGSVGYWERESSEGWCTRRAGSCCRPSRDAALRRARPR